MAGDLAKLLGHSAIYGSGTVLSRLVGFIMLPVYTRYLTPSDYGVLQLLVLTTDIIGIVIGIGVHYGIARFYYFYADERDKNEVVATAFITTLAIYSATTAVLLIFAESFSRLLFGDITYAGYLALVLVNLWLTVGCEIPLVFIRAQQKSAKFVAIGVARLLLHVSLNVLFVVILHAGVKGVLYSALISSALTSAALTVDTFRRVPFSFSLSKATELIRYGSPMILSHLSAFVVTFSDRYFLRYYGTLDDVGVYSLGYKFGMLMTVLFIGPFNQIWSVQMFEIAKKGDAPQIFRKVFSFFSFGLVGAALFFALFSKDAIRIMAANTFWSAHTVVPVVLLAYVMYGFFIFTQVGILVSRRTGYLGVVSAAAALSNIVLNWLLIPRWGMHGAAWATVLGFLVRFLGAYAASQKLFPIPLDWIKVFKVFSLAIVIYWLSVFAGSDALMFSLSVNGLLFVVFLLAAYRIGILSTQEKRQLVTFIQDRMAAIR